MDHSVPRETGTRCFVCPRRPPPKLPAVSLFLEMADTHSRSKKASLPLFSVEDVQLHNKEKDAWITHRGKVYDVSDFLERHPGGKDILVSYAGQDVTTLMTQPEIHQHTSFAYGWLGKYQIGRLKGNVSKRAFCTASFGGCR